MLLDRRPRRVTIVLELALRLSVVARLACDFESVKEQITAIGLSRKPGDI
jgi:hypothetical protein